MPTVDPHAADPTKVTASLVREARSLLRRAAMPMPSSQHDEDWRGPPRPGGRRGGGGND